MSNYIFENITEENCKEILRVLNQIFPDSSNKQTPHCIKSLQLSCGFNKIFLNHYNSYKLMIQGNCPKLEEGIRQISTELKFSPLNKQKEEKRQQISMGESKIIAKYFVGFDESGKGECMGPMILGAIRFEKERLNFLRERLGKRDIKILSWEEINKLYNSLIGNFEYKIKSISPEKIDTKNLNNLLDENYSELINKISKSPEEEAFFIDNYGVSFEFNDKLNRLKLKGAKIILAEKVDVNYVAGALASLVARKHRNDEMVVLSKENVLPGETNNLVKFKSGAVNEETEIYLKRYRELFSYADLPNFIRKSWSNIRKFEEDYPKKELEISYKCNNCSNRSHVICLEIKRDSNESEFFCSNCGNKILKKEINGLIRKKPIIVDTSAIISRTITKDLGSNNYFEGCSFVLTSSIYEEIDSKQPSIKTGAMKEIDELKKMANQEIISFKNHESEDHREIPIDKKLIRITRNLGGTMLTKDSNLASFSLMGAFVIRIVENKSSYLKYIKKYKT